jgi:hypothetical protein
MLVLIQERKSKKDAQATLVRNLKAALPSQGSHKIGFKGGNINKTVYSAGERKLWVAFDRSTEDDASFWNAFGIYSPNLSSQTITVEINIDIDSNTERVAGFFAKDVATGDIFLMHSGKVGGGRPGIGKSTFLVWSKQKLVPVIKKGGDIREGILVSKLDDRELTNRIWKFVRDMQSFKDQAAAGGLEFKRQVKEYDKYRKEFSGRKRGIRGGAFQYVTYHGDIVQKLYDDRTACLKKGEKVSNSPLIDLFVKKDGVLSEVYEVKTGVDRQMLYTAIGQLVTHAATGGEGIKKILVVPTDEDIPKGLEQAIAALEIQVLRFQLRIGRQGKGPTIDLRWRRR